MLEVLFTHWKSFFKIIVITSIFVSIGVYMIIDYLREYLLDNWQYYSQQPFIIPFTGIIKRRPGKSVLQSTITNFTETLWIIVREFLLLFVKPFYPVFSVLVRIIGEFKNILDNFRRQFKVMRNFLYRMIEKIYIRLQDSVAAISIYFFKLRESLKRQMGLYKMLSWTIAHAYYFLYSLVKGPVGKMGRFAEKWGLTMSGFTLGFPGIALWFSTVCFDENTVIACLNTEKYIKDIEVGDILINNTVVLGKCEFDISSDFTLMFDYDGIIVSGDHIVKEGHKCIRVRDSKKSKHIFYNKPRLYSLITSAGIIMINGIQFMDYLDTHDKNINKQIHRLVEVSLNPNYNIPDNEQECEDLVWGICSETSIIDSKGNAVWLKDINIGDKINESTIKGIVHLSSSSITGYIYNRGEEKLTLSGNQLVKENDKWIRVHNSKFSTKCTTKVKNYINFVTDTGIINIGNIQLRDFIETHSLVINKTIDSMVNSYFDNQNI